MQPSLSHSRVGVGGWERPHRGEEPELENERAGFLTVCSGLFILTDIPAAQGPSQRLKSQAFQVIQTIFLEQAHLSEYSSDTYI